MSDSENGKWVYSELRGSDRTSLMVELAAGEGAQAVIAGLSLEFVFGRVWARDGLDRKQRSLVTIGTLIALRQTSELENHFRVGLTNGLTFRELEEAVIQTAPYAGFPAAWRAAELLAELAKTAGSCDTS
ncbi:carboxymuconolactone decarboxylase family protein [Pararhizobium sp. DWP3-4]|uniref:carboxymuconolactone decarboxylase family protein n=1 Tax=Pararhizobium sp. DWP3-4 TaxID=2804565 RepID=UPI003CEF2A3E